MDWDSCPRGHEKPSSSGPYGHTPQSASWLAEAVVQSCRSEQWTQLLSTVNDRIQAQVTSMDLPLFSDMDGGAQCAMVEKEFKEVGRLMTPLYIRYVIYFYFISVGEIKESRFIPLQCCVEYSSGRSSPQPIAF